MRSSVQDKAGVELPYVLSLQKKGTSQILSELSSVDNEWTLVIQDGSTLDKDFLDTVLRHTSEGDIIYTWYRTPQGETSNRLFNAKALARHNYIPSTMLVKTKLLRHIEGVDVRNPRRTWLLALRAGAKFCCVPEVKWEFAPPVDYARLVLLAGAIQKPEEVDWLVEQIKGEDLYSVVEIGTNKGGTLWLWLQFAKHVVSVDLPGGEFGGGYNQDDVSRFRSWVKPDQTLELIAADSHSDHTLRKTKKKLAGHKADLLFIDGDHTYEGVKQDYEMYSPLVRDGGLIVFHDITFHPDHPDCKVDEFWNELEGDKTQFIADPVTWGGIGILRKRGSSRDA